MVVPARGVCSMSRVVGGGRPYSAWNGEVQWQSGKMCCTTILPNAGIGTNCAGAHW